MTEAVAQTRILVVDDEPVVLQLVTSLLTPEGLSVVTARTVAEALAALDVEPALAIVDKNLPDGTGLEIVAALRRRWPLAEAIMFTGYASFDSVVEALRLGAFDYLTKPLRDINEIRHKVRLALERRTLLIERERTLRALQEAQRMQALAAHSEMMAQLGRQLAGIVHELRSPLMAIRVNVERVKQEIDAGRPITPREAKSLADALEGVDQVASVTLDVRRVSSVNAFARDVRARVSIREVVDRAVNLTRGEVSARAVVNVIHEGEGEVMGSPVRLTQVLINLLSNASQAMRKFGHIEVRSSVAAGRVRLDVSDDGVGIPVDAQPRIFEPFFTTRGGGVGLGLSLAREIVTEHGGTITAQSSGEGTTFVIDLPAA